MAITILDIVDEILDQIRGPDDLAIDIPKIQSYINSAAREASSSGWVLPIEEDESLTFSANTYEYTVPSGFAYIYELRVEDDTTTPSTWNEIIEKHLWRVGYDESVDKIFFHRAYVLPVDKSLKVVGQKRLSTYSSLSDSVDVGPEAFLRARAMASALGFVHSAGEGLDAQRFGMWQQHRRDAELLLSRQPMLLRVKPDSVWVPGR